MLFLGCNLTFIKPWDMVGLSKVSIKVIEVCSKVLQPCRVRVRKRRRIKAGSGDLYGFGSWRLVVTVTEIYTRAGKGAGKTSLKAKLVVIFFFCF
jgi:hypothetical protein